MAWSRERAIRERYHGPPGGTKKGAPHFSAPSSPLPGVLARERDAGRKDAMTTRMNDRGKSSESRRPALLAAASLATLLASAACGGGSAPGSALGGLDTSFGRGGLITTQMGGRDDSAE